jgi:predicted dienelactone hydrolase
MDPHNEPFNVSDDLSKYPLIIWAVGTANTPISIGSIYDVVKELPKQGYIVLVLFYNDSIFGSIPNVFDAGFTKITLEDIPSIAIRSYATSKAIDALEVNPVFNTHIDFTKIGIFGNSYGGTLAAFMTGAKGIADSSNYSFTSLNTDNRITCSYSMVSYLGDQLFGTVLEGMRYITKPTMMVTVENDELTSQLEFSRGVSWISADKYFVTLEGISHSGSLLNEVNYKYTSLFFNAYLKNNTESLIQLQSIQSTSGTEVNYFN